MDVPAAPALPQPSPTRRAYSASSLAIQAVGALFWGIFISIAPLDLLLFGSPLWMLIFAWREYARTKRHPFLAGFLLRAAVIAAIVTMAVYAPVKDEDRRVVEGLPGNVVTLGDLANAARMRVPQDRMSVQVTLPSARPTFRQLAKAVEDQTGLRCKSYCCGNGKTILFGASVMGFAVERY